MESRIGKRKHLLLPRYFKKIGIALIILAFVPVIILRLMGSQVLYTHKDLIQTLLWGLVIGGLVFIAWSEDKVEDEMTISLRLDAISGTVGWAVLYVVIRPVLDLIWGQAANDIDGQKLIMIMLLLFLLKYYGQKNRR